MQLEPVIGLEIHVQLKTKSKMFCSCANIFGEVEANSAICPICLGYPGTLPVPNQQAIQWAQLTGAALQCELAAESKFDRKSYFYPDLPKGYQISQYDKPFCGRGEFSIQVDGKEKIIGITRIHLEEDAAKNTHPATSSGQAPHTLVDYNRAGTPLIEIVTEPDITTPQEAKIFLQELQKLVRALGVSDADMEKGQMRCDANISLARRSPASQAEALREGSGEGGAARKLNPKTEIKNVNSFRFVERALEYEIDRQTKLWEQGEIPTHATRGYDSERGVTTQQRVKEEAADYRYFPEPDIPPFVFNEEYLNNIRRQLPELPHMKRNRFQQQYGVTEDQAQLFAQSPDLAHMFEDTTSELLQLDKEQDDIAPEDVSKLVSLAARIILRDVRQLFADKQVTYPETPITAANFSEMVVLLHQGKINRSALQPMLEEMQKTGGDPDHIIQNLGLEQVSGDAEIEKFVDEVIAEHPDAIEKVKAGKEATLQFLMGQVMGKTKGRANPAVVIELLRKKILQ